MPTHPVATGLVLGLLVDGLVGDPSRAHPVAGYGTAVARLERRSWSDSRARGAVFTGLAVAPLLFAARALDGAARHRPMLLTALTAAATWTVVGGRSLRCIGSELAVRLAAGDTAGARALVPSLCGRDPESLDDAGIARACVESLAENTSDAVVAPLMWGALLGLPGLLGYRAVNTLDAMVGHRSPRYARFGTASARLDDAANLVPARLTGLLTLAAAPLVGGSAREGWAAWRSDAGRHPSPNAGVCEATAAGVLGVGLGGTTVYGGRVEERPVLGRGRPPQVIDIRRAVRLSHAVELGSLGVAVAIAGRRSR